MSKDVQIRVAGALFEDIGKERLGRGRSFSAASREAPWTSAVEPIRSIVARFPQRELEIRRLCARSAEFRSVCADYEEAMTALSHWRKAGEPGERKVEEYTNFLGELEVEILARLDRQEPNSRRAC